MSLPTFTGTNTQLVWQNEPDINNPGGNPDPLNGFPFGTMGSQRTYDPFNTNITWSPSFPLLTNLTVNQVVQLLRGSTENPNNYSLSAIIKLTVTSGNQFHSLSIPTINLNVYLGDGGEQIRTTNIVPIDAIGTGSSGQQGYCNDTNTVCPTYTFPIGPQISPFSPLVIQVVPWNNGTQVILGNLRDFTLQAVMTVTLTVTCSTGPELETKFCMSYCNANTSQCLPAFTNFCFSGINESPPVIPLTSNTACQLFFEQLYTQNGPDAQTDRQISNYCQAKYPTSVCFEGLLFASPPVSSFEQELCACHLSTECYDNYINSLSTAAPAFANFFKNSGINERCFISRCAGSTFPSIEIGKVCKIPACINVVNFNNNGSIGSGGVTISQDSQCQQINNSNGASGGTGGNGTPTNQSWWDKHWIWVVVGVGVLLALIIVILIIVGAEESKKKPVFHTEV